MLIPTSISWLLAAATVNVLVILDLETALASPV